jgi:signal transduction histidine kinase
MTEVITPENVEVQTRIDKNIPEVPADAQLLKRVFFNLLNNALQAMPKGGKLKVKMQNRKNPKGEDKVLISFEDTGVGIPEEVKPKIFKPLFTTKSKGQGFGLVVCKRVIEAHGGTIGFESEEGKGTKFTVELPIENTNAN